MKKLLSLLLALSLCMNLPLLAFASEREAQPFTDVRETDWYGAAVQWALEHDITQGVSQTEFGAGRPVTRAQMVTFLWRMAGAPEPASVRGFADVPDEAWFADAVNWAAERGIAKGTSSSAFSPDDALTREQAAAFLYREEQRRGGGFSGLWAFPLRYGDADQVSDYAYEPLCWMTMHGILLGSDGLLSPRGICSRAQLVTMLYRYVEELDTPQEPAYTEQDVPVLRDSLDSTETARLRFYEDLPGVPYMELTEYYNQFYLLGTTYQEGVTVSRLGSHVVLSNLLGCTAEADTRTDTIVTEDLYHFVSPAYYLNLSDTQEADANYPFLDVGYRRLEPEQPDPMTLRLGDYGIDLRGGADGLYLPLGTLSDLYATAQLIYTVYNGEKLYVQDYIGDLQPGSALAEDEDFSAPFLAARSAELAEYTYRELCFNIDTFYGRPGREYIHEAWEDQDLDAILSTDYPEIKAQLCSTDFAEFFTGLHLLLYGLLFDGGHTGVVSRLQTDMPELVQRFSNALVQTAYAVPLLVFSYNQLLIYALDELRETVYEGDYYAEQGDTALIRFDQFWVESEAWKSYYAGTGAMPLEDDALGTVYAGLQRAAANPEIRNVVLDLSCNGGGNSAALLAIEWLLTGEGHVSYESLLTGQVQTEGNELDANFDGAFDENDKPITQFRYGVLTSSYTFSSANAFAFFMKEHGAMILGLQSGGGACAVRMSTAGGVEFSSSTASHRIINDAGDSVDAGCPVDLELYHELEEADLERYGGSLSAGFEDFYDLDVLSDAMNAFFDAAERDAA